MECQIRAMHFFVKEYKNSIPLLDTNYEILFGKFSLAYIAKNCKKKEQADDLLLIVIKLAVDLLCEVSHHFPLNYWTYCMFIIHYKQILSKLYFHIKQLVFISKNVSYLINSIYKHLQIYVCLIMQ